MFTVPYTEDAKRVIAGYCIQPKCNLKMHKNMPHLDGEKTEPICNACNVYYTILGNGHVITNHEAIKEFNRRWAEYNKYNETGV